MSKLWLLLLLVAAFQAVHSYPASEPDYLEDPESTLSILQEAWGKLKDKYTEMGKEKLQQVISVLKDKLCNQQDFEDDFEDDEAAGSLQYELLKKLKDLMQKGKDAAGAEKEKIKDQIEALRAKLCDRLSDFEEEVEFMEEDEMEEDPAESTWDILKETWGKLKDKYTDMSKEKLQKIISMLKDKLCKDQDFEEDFEDDEAEGSLQYQLLQKLKDLMQKAKEAAGAEKEKIKEQIEALRAKLCDQLSDFEEEVELMDEDEMEEDPGQSTLDILKDALGKIKDRWSAVSKEKMEKVIAVLKDKFCGQQSDFEEDEEQGGIINKYKLAQKMKELYDKAQAKFGQQKEKLEKAVQIIREKFCARLNNM